jgi:hypothetical protein
MTSIHYINNFSQLGGAGETQLVAVAVPIGDYHTPSPKETPPKETPPKKTSPVYSPRQSPPSSEDSPRQSPPSSEDSPRQSSGLKTGSSAGIGFNKSSPQRPTKLQGVLKLVESIPGGTSLIENINDMLVKQKSDPNAKKALRLYGRSLINKLNQKGELPRVLKLVESIEGGTALIENINDMVVKQNSDPNAKKALRLYGRSLINKLHKL